MSSYLLLVLVSLLPVLFSAIFYILEKRTVFGYLPFMTRQLIIGVVFGLLAVLGTECGIPINGAQVNCRDAAVLTAGLMFGGPAGIIAGLIGGIERWFAVYWGVGELTRVACSVSTIAAGFYAAILRRYMFEGKKPGAIFALFIGIVMEVFHLTMVFVTNLGQAEIALNVVEACTIPMVAANSISVMLSAIVISCLAKEKIVFKKNKLKISQEVQQWLLITVILAFAVTSIFVFQLQQGIAMDQATSLLTLSLEETTADVHDVADNNMISVAKNVAKAYKKMAKNQKNLNSLKEMFEVSEISYINSEGIIEDSTEPNSIGFNMYTGGTQSSEFMKLFENSDTGVQAYMSQSKDSSTYMKYAGVKIDDGILQIGYDGSAFQNLLENELKDITKNRHVGETGYIIILDEHGNLVSAPESINEVNIIRFARNFTEEKNPGEIFDINTPLGDSFCCYDQIEGYTVMSLLPKEEAYKMRNVVMYVNSFMEILVFAVLFALIYTLVKRVVVNKIKAINSSLAKITRGNLDEEVNVRNNEEFAYLSDDINSTVRTLKAYIREASARIDQELEFATNIQISALPAVTPAISNRKEFEIYASMNPAKEVGGDFYDFYITDGEVLNFLIADVSGKGIPAAMFMMRAKTELKTLTESNMPLDEVFTVGNNALCEGNNAGMFVTAWQGALNLNTGLIKFANAGHNPPLVRHADGKFEYLQSRAGLVLAGMEGIKYRVQELQMEPGDIIFMYTDGVTEATNAYNELYGEDRLLAYINRGEFDTMEELCKGIREDVDKFVDEAPQFDDITMVAVKYNGKPAVPSIHFDEITLEQITDVTEFAEGVLESLEFSMKHTIQINIAIDEIYSNIARYAYKDGTGPVTVEIEEVQDPHAVQVRFIDEGVPFNPLNKEAPDTTLSSEERKIGGLGIFMVRKSMDDVRYRYENDKNILTLTKNF